MNNEILKGNIIHFYIKNFDCEYEFYNNDAIGKNKKVLDNIKKSNIMIFGPISFLNNIKSSNEPSNKEENQNFIFCFHDTILILDQNSFPNLNYLFSEVKELNIHFIGNKNNFPNLKIKIHQIICNLDKYIREIYHYIRNIVYSKQSTNIWKQIRYYISSYLLYDSYLKTNYNRFDETIPPPIIEINENDYIYLDKISSGSSFSANLIYHIIEKKLFVIKDPWENDEKLFNREYENYKFLRKFNYPMIPKLIGTTKYRGTLCIVIEYINGQTLSSMKSIILEKKIYYIFQIMLIIEFFHLNGYVLRDLKPNNIMIDNNDNVIFIDFDRLIFYKSISETDNHTNSFSSAYKSPEANSSDFSYETDIFSLGKIIYFIVTGTIPKNDDEEKNFNGFDIFGPYYYMCCIKEYKKRPFISRIINLFYLQFIDFLELFDLRGLFGRNEIISKQKLSNDVYTQNLIKSINLRKWNNDQFEYKAMLDYYLQQSHTNVFEQIIFCRIYMGNKYIYPDFAEMIEHFSLATNIELAQKYVIDLLEYLSDQNNDPFIQSFLGIIYLNYGFDSLNQNDIKLLNKIAFQNYDYSTINNKLYHTLTKIFKDRTPDYARGIEYLTKAANQNDSNSQLILANIYADHQFIKRNLNKSMYYIKLAAENNHPIAQFAMGFSYFLNSFLNPNDIDAALKYLNLAAQLDQRMSMLVMGIVHLTDQYFDIKKSVHFLSRLADYEDEDALLILGFIYSRFSFFKFNSKDIELINMHPYQNKPFNIFSKWSLKLLFKCQDYINTIKGIEYLKKSANKNNSTAKFFLGIIFLFSPYVPHDKDQGFYYLNCAKKENEDFATLILGWLFFIGKYVKKDVNKALQYFKSLENNNENQIIHVLLGFIYGFMKHDLNKAISYLTDAARANISYAQTYLAYLYAFEAGNLEKGMNWFTIAALNNESYAQLILGLFYLKGVYYKQDINTALDLLKKSANNKDSIIKTNVNYYLGIIFHEGKYTERNLKEAIHYYKEGCCINDRYSKNNLGIIYKNGFSDQIQKNVSLSIIYFKENIKLQDTLSMFNLAKIYIFEESYENIDESIQLLIDSSNKSLKISYNLLCIALIIKYGFIIDDIKQNIKHSFQNVTENLENEIYKIIKCKNLLNQETFAIEYDKYKNDDFLYNFEKEIVKLSSFLVSKPESESSKLNNIPDINKEFYEGFGLKI